MKPKPSWLIRLLTVWLLAGDGLSLRAAPGLDLGTPVNFFTGAANVFLKTSGYNFTVTNIPIYPTNYYTPALHRLLQLAANIYDASTNRAFDDGTSPNGPFYPTVFRPTFFSDGTNVCINGYVEDISVAPVGSLVNAYSSIPYSLPEDLNSLPKNTNSAINIYGIPYVIGARKGFPNFNQFSMQSISLITRKVQLVRVNNGDPITALQTNIQYILSISNALGFSVWNSYQSSISRPVDIIGVDDLSMFLKVTNDVTQVATNLAKVVFTPLGFAPPTIQTNQWVGFNPRAANPMQNQGSFQIPLIAALTLVSNGVYHPNSATQLSTDTTFDTGLGNYQPHFLLNVTNRLRFIMVDHATGRLIDYVHFSFNDGRLNRDLLAEFPAATNDHGGIWDTNQIGVNGPILGVANQIQVSLGTTSIPGYLPFTAADWESDSLVPPPGSEVSAQTAFRAFYFGTAAGSAQAYAPTLVVAVTSTWQANDPLVHYTLGDLSPLPSYLGALTNYLNASPPTYGSLTNLNVVNHHYEPWGNTGNGNSYDNYNKYNLAVKDPLVSGSDYWNFTNTQPLSFALLGTIHRGTPWQTFYLKSATVVATNWQTWTGNTNAQDALLSQPTNDWNLAAALIPLLTPQDPHQLYGYNQSSAGAWSPVFQGMTVITNAPGGLTSFQIDDTLNSNALVQMVSGINAVRNLSPGRLFTNLAQILAVPELSVASPFINPGGGNNSVSDAAYESIPSQLLPLLRPDSVGSVVSASNPPQFQFTGIDGYAYNVQASTDLVAWVPVATIYPTNGAFVFSDTNQPAFAQRYYRTALAP